MSKKPRDQELDQKHPYVFFECCLINHIQKEIDNILDYAIIKFASKLEITDYNLLCGAIQLYVNDKLPSRLNKAFIAAKIDADVADKYALTGAYNSLLNAVNRMDEDIEKFKSDLRPYVQIDQAIKKLRLQSINYDSILAKYRRIKTIVDNFEVLHGKDAVVGVKITMLIDFRDTEKSYRDFELLKGFLAIKSILGDKDFVGTNKAFVTARMIGAKTPKIVSSLMVDKATKKLYAKFTGRYFYDQLLYDLEDKNFIMSRLPGNRCIYLSTSLSYELLKVSIQNYLDKSQRANKKSSLKEKRRQFKIEYAK
ncbi:MAG: hypothetical protein JWR02_1540 [Mucilaginibacter sp.]|nr:hypothetical protein [Mucilaginibacter sp.]